MTILAGYVGGLTGDDHAVDGFMQKGAEVFAVLRELVDFVYCSVASLRSGLHMLSFKPLSWGHVPGLALTGPWPPTAPAAGAAAEGKILLWLAPLLPGGTGTQKRWEVGD